MKDIIISLFLTIVLVAIVLVGTVVPIQIITLPDTYAGSREFSSIEELYKFQDIVIEEVRNREASLLSFDISILSPPKVYFKVYSPHSPFSHGRQFLNPIIAYSSTILISIILGGLFIAGIIVIWKE